MDSLALWRDLGGWVSGFLADHRDSKFGIKKHSPTGKNCTFGQSWKDTLLDGVKYWLCTPSWEQPLEGCACNALWSHCRASEIGRWTVIHSWAFSDLGLPVYRSRGSTPCTSCPYRSKFWWPVDHNRAASKMAHCEPAEQQKMHSCLVKRMLCNIKLQIAYECFPCMWKQMRW